MLYNINIEMANRCGEMLSVSRYRSGLSRKAMSEAMGVSESTIKAWEDGQGSPTLFGMLEWFRITGTSYFRAMLGFFWPDAFWGLKGSDSGEKIKNALMTYLSKVAGPNEIKKLHYIVFGNHGSEWSGLLDMACAHEHTSLKSRYRISEIIQASFDISHATYNVSVPNIDINMDRSLLENAIRAAEASQKAKLSGYTIGEIYGKNDNIVSGILLQSRLDAGVSRKDLAKALGKTERTIQNWESGFSPSFLDVCMWFSAIEKPAWSYIQNAIYNHKTNNYDSYAEECRQELIEYFSAADIIEIRKVSFAIMGDHGSNWLAMLEALLEHVCSPLAQRVISARSILISYSIESQHTEIIATENILPDLENLRRCIELGTEAAKAGKNSYCENKSV